VNLRPYLITLDQLREHPKPASWWASHRLTPCVLLQSPSLFRAEDAPKFDAAVREIAALAWPSFYVASWCFEPGQPGPLTKLSAAAWSAFLGNVARLGASLHAHGGAGLIIDCEYYPATPGSSGGPMLPGAWVGIGPSFRGAGLGHSLGNGLTLGAMVWGEEFSRPIGLDFFWRSAWQSVGKPHSILLAEDYVGKGNKKLIENLGAQYLSGGWIKKPGTLPKADWYWDPEALMLRG
jgi:hypothetical protein